jgi:hypothetical protein
MSRYLISEYQQGTPEWKRARAGKATGSRASDILAKIKTGEAAVRRNYRMQLVTERLTHEPAENGFVSKEMEWGTAQEPFARMAYERATGRRVSQFGFLYLPEIMAGCSVDGLIEEGGVFEAKCPLSATHVSYLLANRIPPVYIPQLTHNLWITGEPFADFVSYDPRMPAHLQYFCIRMPRDEAKIQVYETEILQFLTEVDALEQQLKKSD